MGLHEVNEGNEEFSRPHKLIYGNPTACNCTATAR
jgi:hypothetical protein